MDCPTQKILLKTHRFVLSNEIIDYLSEFAKIHQFDDRKTFKEEWQSWIKGEEVEPLINEEVKRLTNTGFKGDVLDKMFKSTRYYYRNKSKNNDSSDEKKVRKSYETICADILERMDKHIHFQINNHAKLILDDDTKMSTISPAESFNLYLLGNKVEILELLQEAKDGSNDGSTITKKDVEEMIKKYKKTYKNRFYNIRVSLQK
jgi:endo-alpha-1,4-polygalactosaminidase (GH114 family)